MLNTWSASSDCAPPATPPPMIRITPMVSAQISTIIMRTKIMTAPRSPLAIPAPCRIGTTRLRVVLLSPQYPQS